MIFFAFKQTLKVLLEASYTAMKIYAQSIDLSRISSDSYAEMNNLSARV